MGLHLNWFIWFDLLRKLASQNRFFLDPLELFVPTSRVVLSLVLVPILIVHALKKNHQLVI